MVGKRDVNLKGLQCKAESQDRLFHHIRPKGNVLGDVAVFDEI